MAKLQLSMGVCDYDRTRAVLDGRVPVEGCDIIGVAIEPEEVFHRAFRFQEFDIAEMSLSSHMMMVSRGENEYVAVPAFVSRLFRHSGMYIRTDRGISSAADLAGKKIGLPEYQITACVWMRGILQDDFKLQPDSIHWVRGGVEDADRDERAPLDLPRGFDLQQAPAGKTLSGMLQEGELDGVFSARAPSCYTNGVPNVDRLFPDYRKTETDYFRRTGIFPIMHVIGIRKSLVDQHPWLPVSVFKAFIKAKEIAMYELGQIGHLFTSLPWGVAEFESMHELMGEDYWKYGFDGDRHVLDTFARYHHEQGLSARKVEPEELFAASARDLFKI